MHSQYDQPQMDKAYATNSAISAAQPPMTRLQQLQLQLDDNNHVIKNILDRVRTIRERLAGVQPEPDTGRGGDNRAIPDGTLSEFEHILMTQAQGLAYIQNLLCDLETLV